MVLRRHHSRPLSRHRVLRIHQERVVVDHDGYCSDQECEFERSLEYVDVPIPSELEAAVAAGQTEFTRAELPVTLVNEEETSRDCPTGESYQCHLPVEVENDPRYQNLKRHTINYLVVNATVEEVTEGE